MATMPDCTINVKASDEFMKAIQDSIESNDRVLTGLRERKTEDARQIRRGRINVLMSLAMVVLDVVIIVLLVKQ